MRGTVDEALDLVATALETADTICERWFEAELHRHRGVLIAHRRGKDAEAEACFHRALGLARLQSAHSWELRAATSLARLWRDQGRCDEARNLLAPVYGWFTEGFDTPDLQEAKRCSTSCAEAGLCPVWWLEHSVTPLRVRSQGIASIGLSLYVLAKWRNPA